jgi:hypothetical protein
MAVSFYKELNELRTADIYSKKKNERSKYYEVERIASKRMRKCKVS